MPLEEQDVVVGGSLPLAPKVAAAISVPRIASTRSSSSTKTTSSQASTTRKPASFAQKHESQPKAAGKKKETHGTPPPVSRQRIQQGEGSTRPQQTGRKVVLRPAKAEPNALVPTPSRSKRGSGWSFGELENLVSRAVHKTEKGANDALHAAGTAKRLTLDLAALAPYAEYYAAYEVGKKINELGAKGGTAGRVAGHIAALPLVEMQAKGLLGDALVDLLKGESVRDEGVRGAVNPLHSFTWLPGWMRKGPNRYLPGITKKGVDIEW